MLKVLKNLGEKILYWAYCTKHSILKAELGLINQQGLFVNLSLHYRRISYIK